MDAEIPWPQKRRDIHNHHMDSTVWDGFRFRDGDVVIATYGKSGSTWMQQIVSQLLFDGSEGLPVAEMSPWLELRVPEARVKLEALEAQKHRRFVKTHLPVDALVYSPKARYIYVARDGRDVVWSLYNHHLNANDAWYEVLNETPGLVGPPIERPPDDIRVYWREWMERDGYPFWSFWENVRSWWEIRRLPNLLVLHYADLKEDPEGQIRNVADFLGIEPLGWERILLHSSFDYMKENATASVPLGGAFWEGGAKTFIYKGVNGRWRDALTADESAAYEMRAAAELGEDCAHWLAEGGRV